MSKMAVTALVAFAIGAGAGYYIGFDVGFERAMRANISSFEECVAAGNAVMESFPRQCRTDDGKHFVEDIES